MDQTVKGDRITETYWSVTEYADASVKRATKVKTRDQKKYFLDLPDYEASVSMLRMGWPEELPAALEIAESAVATANREHMMDTFNPVWDVTGAEVDVARYLSGEPECMIDFPLTKTSKSGRVVTMVAPICFSSWVDTDSVLRRGHVIVALALALSQLGHACEIWADINLDGHVEAYQRVCLKGASDELDPGTLMFALAHAAMLRRVAFGTFDGFPPKWREPFSDNANRGSVGRRSREDIALFPEGTIFLPELTDESDDYANADVFLREHLGNLGLLADAE